MNFTPSEYELIAMLLNGLTNKEISLVRGVNMRTTRRQFYLLYNKTGMGTKLELLVWAFDRWNRKTAGDTRTLIANEDVV